ncbi:unnamed protein product [Penicillium glandicola]
MASVYLPPELLAMITSLSDFETLKTLRLTSRMMCAFAIKHLFSTVLLYEDEESCDAFESIMAHPHLEHHVHKIHLNTVEDDYPSDRHHEDLELPLRWWKLLPML